MKSNDPIPTLANTTSDPNNSASSMTDGTPSLLNLPLELRETIYSEVLLQPAQAPHLLQVCREIYAEAQKFLFQRVLVFQSQSVLQTWLKEVPQNLLQHVSEVSIELQDVDLSPLLDPATPLHTWDMYERELQNLRRALEQVPHVKRFSLRALYGHQSHLYSDFLDETLRMVATVFPGLVKLGLGGNFHRQGLAFLRSFKKLKSFSFGGFSASKASQTAEILTNLPLTDITLVSQQALLTPIHHQHSSFPSMSKSFDGSVLRTLNQLASFSVDERFSSASSSALFFTSDMLSSLHSHKTLTSLSIILSRMPEESALEALADFLDKSSSIKRLELDWPDLDMEVLETNALLSNSLSSLWIRSTSMASAFDILCHILGAREAGSVPELRRVVLVRHAWDTAAVGDETELDVSTAVKAGGEYGPVSTTVEQKVSAVPSCLYEFRSSYSQI
jgi:hypothetical protein